PRDTLLFTVMATKSQLRTLADLLLNSVNSIETRLASRNLAFPSLATPFDPHTEAESVLRETDMLSAVSQIVAAASQMIAMVRTPVETVMEYSMLYHLPSCLRAAIESNVVEIVGRAGPKGIHIHDIARINGTSPQKLGRILRLLANHHIFREIRRDVFCANRLSSVLDSGKSLEKLDANPQARYENSSGVAALVVMHADEGLKSSAFLTEAFLSPCTAHSTQATDSPWNIAFQTNMFIFDYYDKPKKAHLKVRFSSAMACSTRLEPPAAILAGFDWTKLPVSATVVDVGGGVGATSLIIAKNVPHLNLVVQDRTSVISVAHKYWPYEMIASGRVRLQEHDFFSAQPIRDADVFLLRWIMHDYDDTKAWEILQNLREAATSSTKLVTVDILMPHTCIDDEQDSHYDIPGAFTPSAPGPLLPNMGAANNMKYWLDMQVRDDGADVGTRGMTRLADVRTWKQSGTNIAAVRCVGRMRRMESCAGASHSWLCARSVCLDTHMSEKEASRKMAQPSAR
ncbi:unnamed protein product, partial [Mycena citricolor]